MKPAYKPVLCVVSSHPIKGASGVPTGFFLAELTHPLKAPPACAPGFRN